MDSEQIEVLVLRAQEGKRGAMTALYGHFFTPMKRYAMLRVRDMALAEDLVQNVWLKVGKRLRLMNDARVFRSWLYRALRWEIIDWARRQSKVEVASVDSLTAENGYEEAAIAYNYRPDIEDVAPLLAALKKEEREVMELFYLSELSVNETALVLSIPVGTVKSRLHGAREKLRHIYANEE
ncbi:RNA polymerase sigma factor [Aliidiomarina soli]|uniref:RNA polymerase subunit sigma-24 n=1 Tax=Aliidiomarina soli TaxID=1928574 RepID=A0A432WIV0_9GAMM|nr:sigma-70 family RNA polymerase sigma factor [Aliidiomarina soli]RUO33756.1 hypothetical protein CWE14_04635 [Aliidiomarina soli]